MTAIQTISMRTAKGNTLQLFYNNETGLIVADLVSANGQGGNEILRKRIDENLMLLHTTKPPVRKRKT